MKTNDDPAYAKYYRMKQVGVPKQCIIQKMNKDGLDPGMLFEGEKKLVSVKIVIPSKRSASAKNLLSGLEGTRKGPVVSLDQVRMV